MNRFPSALIFVACFIFQGAAKLSAQEQPGKLQRAADLFERYEYYESARIYRELADRKNPSPAILERLAACYIKMNDYESAEKWEGKLAATGNSTQYAYAYGELLIANQKFDEAKTQFRRFYGVTNKEKLALKLATCDSALRWMNDPPVFTVNNFTEANTAWSDWGGAWLNGSLIFTSDRVDEKLKGAVRYPWTNNGFLKLYAAGPISAELSGLERLFSGSKYHYGPVAFSASGDTAYVTVTSSLANKHLYAGWSELSDHQLYTHRLELLIALKRNGKWDRLASFAYNNVNAWSIGQAALSADGSVLYFVSDMPGGQGKTDIWYSEKQKNGAWGKPVNCGKTINTPLEDAFPTVYKDRLYFSSKGRPGMGGFDLFEAKGSKNSWQTAVNLKYPVNSTRDDFWLINSDEDTGYLSSDRAGGQGNDDLYKFQRVPAPAGNTVLPAPVTARKDTIDSVPAMRPGDRFVLNNIYYDLDKWDIRPDAAKELDKLAAVLFRYPLLELELSSHTDSRAPDEYNLLLSQRRAEAAVRYLVAKGIEAKRLIAKGYGESQLVNGCSNGVSCTIQEHQANRRTEIRVLRN